MSITTKISIVVLAATTNFIDTIASVVAVAIAYCYIILWISRLTLYSSSIIVVTELRAAEMIFFAHLAIAMIVNIDTKIVIIIFITVSAASVIAKFCLAMPMRFCVSTYYVLCNYRLIVIHCR